ncbi:hypothetical protein RJ639_021683 [Escallonia herrerae]|uniref:Uncharacterized protein n=1 Tax=Escallonia herrerae TaxID=1293975 RepID=A0AA88V6R7_9ASTE|nr:hypothetical protein RJ639_021683 [Escallonia herrerae]
MEQFWCSTNKRKATTEDLEQQSPVKKIATDGPVVTLSNNSLPSNMQGETGIDGPLGDSKPGPSSSSRQKNIENVQGGEGRRDKGANQALRTSAAINQTWKDELGSGHLLVSLSELFGESIFSFIPTPEMSLFL